MLAVMLVTLWLVACAGGDGDVLGTPQGPALIMFYTDN